MDVRGFAATRPGGELEEITFELPEVGPEEVRIEVDCCGLCASDLDMIDGTFAGTSFPAVPGHEVVGRVVECGSAVTTLAVGERVGVGPLRASCGTCEWCECGEAQVCRDNQFTMGAGHFGGIASHIQVTEPFAFTLPDNLDALSAAPSCALAAPCSARFAGIWTAPGASGSSGWVD